MIFNDFKASIQEDYPPANSNKELKALWWDAKGNWEKAHRIVQSINNTHAAWIHAYLHRKEGDLSNASFWYTNAGRKMATCSLDSEWNKITESIL